MKHHAHQCWRCGRRWTHSDSNVGDEESHKCQYCGTVQWWKTSMSKTEDLIATIKSVKPMDVVNHPISFGFGVGIANGIVAKARGKSIDVPTSIALALILGAGEAVIEHFDKTKPPEEKIPPVKMGLYSILGVAAGILPFIEWDEIKPGERARPIPIVKRKKKKETVETKGVAV